MVKVLSENEQKMMNIEEAGELYHGHFIFFTNRVNKREGNTVENYGVPRIISDTESEFYRSGLFKDFDDEALYGLRFYCTVFMPQEYFPELLSFIGGGQRNENKDI
jgi:hypothetical protein